MIGAPLLGLGLATLFGVADAPEPIPEPLAQAAFEREASELARIGLTVVGDRTEALEIGADARRESIALEAGECVGVAATAWGYFEVGRVAIADEAGTDRVLAERSFAVARAAAWCTAAPATFVVRVEPASADAALRRDAYSRGALRWQIARGRVEGLHAGLTRGVPTEAGARAVPREAFIALGDRAAAGERPIGPPIEIRAHRARLLPESAATYSRLHELADHGRGDPVEPRWDPLPPDAPPHWRPLAAGGITPFGLLTRNRQTSAEARHPAIAFRDGTGMRALAILEPSALGLPTECATVQLVRMLWGYGEGAERLTGGAHLTRERGVVSDRVCRTDRATVVYVAPASDHARYLLRLFARET